MDQTKCILIIDDDARNIFALTATLRAAGLICVSASDASEGRLILQSNKNIGMILMDMMMPDMDGYEAISYLRALDGCEDIPVVAVTAQAMPGDRERCIRAGANDYVSKPIDVDTLLGVIARFLK